MFTNSISDQLSGSFEELMQEIRAMRKELERMRVALEGLNAPAAPPARAKPVRTRRHPATRTTSPAA
ncbi:MAG TPA: hypothetical protein VID47_10405 [Actinomycetota bacterium]|jgi:hypothetical protein